MNFPLSLTYQRKAREGVEYVHHFGTGWQELVFPTHEAAAAFAAAEGIVYNRR